MWSIDFRHGRFFELEVIIPYWWTKGIGNITGSRVYTGTRWRQNGVTPEEALLWWKKVQCRIAIKDWHDADLTDCSWNEKKG